MYMPKRCNKFASYKSTKLCITFGCPSESRWGTVLGKRVESATMSVGMRWDKHAPGTSETERPS